MFPSMIRTCHSKSYTDYTVCLSTPYILEALQHKACRESYTDYTDFRIQTHHYIYR